MKTNEDISIPLATKMFARDCSLGRYKASADMRCIFRVRGHQFPVIKKNQFSMPLVEFFPIPNLFKVNQSCRKNARVLVV